MEFNFHLGAPQITILVLYFFNIICGIIVVCKKSAESVTRTAVDSAAEILGIITTQVIYIGILYWGGFFTVLK